MSNKNRETLHSTEKRGNNLALYLLLPIYIYSVIYIYILRSVEHKVLRYIPPNITDVMHLSVTTVP